MMSLSERLYHKENFVIKKENMRTELVEFYKENYEKFEGRNTNPSALEERDNKFNLFFDRFI